VPVALGRSDYLAASVTDCFANATFLDLCTYLHDGGSTYQVNVYAFNEAQWEQTLTEPDGGSSLQFPSPTQPTGSGNNPNQCNGSNSVTAYIGSDGGLVGDLTFAGWRTQCTATQESDIPVIANCLPLTAIPH
jgi:hypothetical protein